MRIAIPALLLGLAAAPAWAQTAPAAGTAVPLSQIIATLEAEADFGRIEDIDWDDGGYWEIEYRRADGSEVEVDIDGATGQPRSR